MPMQHIESHDQRNPETGFLHGDLLQAVGGFGIADADERTDLALADIVLIAVDHGVVDDRFIGHLRDAAVFQQLRRLLLADLKTADR